MRPAASRPSLGQERDPIGPDGGLIDVVQAHDDGQALVACQRRHELEDLDLIVQVEVGSRLVEQQRHRLLGEGPREQDALPFAGRQLGNRAAAQVLEIGAAQGVAITARSSSVMGRHQPRWAARPKRTTSSTERVEPPASSCAAIATRRCAHARPLAQSGSPSKYTTPARGRKRRASVRSNVVLPEPFGPRSASTVPASMPRLTPASTSSTAVAAGQVIDLQAIADQIVMAHRDLVPRTTRKKGPPRIAVSTPTGSSTGAATVRARSSASSKRMAPVSPLAGMR